MTNESDSLNLDEVPLFPLPGVVLLPRAVLPLHIFEFRYRTMTADALRGSRLIAMALLLTGWEKDYHGRPPIEPVVCLGKIRRSEQLADGKYNFLLQGICRATVDREFADRPYRYARLARLPETAVLEIDLTDERRRLEALFCSPPLNLLPSAKHFQQFLAGPLPTSDIADLVAFHFLEPATLKQSILAEGDIGRRVRRVIAALEASRGLTAMLRKDDRARWN